MRLLHMSTLTICAAPVTASHAALGAATLEGAVAAPDECSVRSFSFQLRPTPLILAQYR